MLDMLSINHNLNVEKNVGYVIHVSQFECTTGCWICLISINHNLNVEKSVGYVIHVSHFEYTTGWFPALYHINIIDKFAL